MFCLEEGNERLSSVLSKITVHVNALNVQENLYLSCIPRGEKNVEDVTHEVGVTGTPSMSLYIMRLAPEPSVSASLPKRAHMPCSACL